MKYIAFKILCFISLANTGYSQTDTISVQPSIDTLETHFHNLKLQSNNGKLTYYNNGKKISKAKYDALIVTTIDPNNCKPCYLLAYNGEKLIFEGDFYIDCGIGMYIDYHQNGKIKSKGQFKQNIEQNWDINKSNEWCAIKIGLWQYFDDKGILIRSENYQNGKLVE